jgi:hypothetical protein
MVLVCLESAQQVSERAVRLGIKEDVLLLNETHLEKITCIIQKYKLISCYLYNVYLENCPCVNTNPSNLIFVYIFFLSDGTCECHINNHWATTAIYTFCIYVIF